MLTRCMARVPFLIFSSDEPGCGAIPTRISQASCADPCSAPTRWKKRRARHIQYVFYFGWINECPRWAKKKKFAWLPNRDTSVPLLWFRCKVIPEKKKPYRSALLLRKDSVESMNEAVRWRWTRMFLHVSAVIDSSVVKGRAPGIGAASAFIHRKLCWIYSLREFLQVLNIVSVVAATPDVRSRLHLHPHARTQSSFALQQEGLFFWLLLVCAHHPTV